MTNHQASLFDNFVPRVSLLCFSWSFFQRLRKAEKRDPGNEVDYLIDTKLVLKANAVFNIFIRRFLGVVLMLLDNAFLLAAVSAILDDQRALRAPHETLSR